MSLQKRMDEKVNIEILEANQFKPKFNSLVDVPEWKRNRTQRVKNWDVADNIAGRFEVMNCWDTQK